MLDQHHLSNNNVKSTSPRHNRTTIPFADQWMSIWTPLEFPISTSVGFPRMGVLQAIIYLKWFSMIKHAFGDTPHLWKFHMSFENLELAGAISARRSTYLVWTKALCTSTPSSRPMKQWVVQIKDHHRLTWFDLSIFSATHFLGGHFFFLCAP